MRTIPIDKIKQSLSEILPKQILQYLPDKWEKLGDVLIIKLNSKLTKYTEVIAETYANELNCRSVLQELDGITGIFRQPNVKLIYGNTDTETIHVENKIRYKLDPKKVMFSSGNMDERIRMSTISNKEETIVDLFAGIGYFTLPIAVYSKPKKIISCEINPVSHQYLCDNIVLNDVIDIVEPRFGNNRETAPKNIANQVIMGYIKHTPEFIATAIECLKNYTGIIHYHDILPTKDIPDKPLKIVKNMAKKYNRTAKLEQTKKIKSYAPGITHFILDIKVDEQ